MKWRKIPVLRNARVKNSLDVMVKNLLTYNAFCPFFMLTSSPCFLHLSVSFCRTSLGASIVAYYWRQKSSLYSKIIPLLLLCGCLGLESDFAMHSSIIEAVWTKNWESIFLGNLSWWSFVERMWFILLTQPVSDFSLLFFIILSRTVTPISLLTVLEFTKLCNQGKRQLFLKICDLKLWW